MYISNFFSQYNLHDSLLESIKFDEINKLAILTVDFCYWQQEKYMDNQPETGMVNIIFTNVSHFNYEPYSINSDEITDVKLNSDNSVTIVTLNDITNESHTILIAADNVQIEEVITE